MKSKIGGGMILACVLALAMSSAARGQEAQAEEVDVKLLQAQVNLLQTTNDILRQRVKELEEEIAQLKQLIDPNSAFATPAAPATAPATAPAAPAPAPVAAGAMPQDEAGKLERLLGVLERRIQCTSCKGEPLSTREEHVPTGTAGERQTKIFYESCRPCNATGQTPMREIQPTINLARELLDKYAGAVPGPLQTRANEIIRKYLNPPPRQRWIYDAYRSRRYKGYEDDGGPRRP